MCRFRWRLHPTAFRSSISVEMLCCRQPFCEFRSFLPIDEVAHGLGTYGNLCAVSHVHMSPKRRIGHRQDYPATIKPMEILSSLPDAVPVWILRPQIQLEGVPSIFVVFLPGRIGRLAPDRQDDEGTFGDKVQP